MAALRPWWQRPSLRSGDDGERSVGWLELFFDLVFVVILAVLAHDLAQHVDGAGFVRFALQFMAVFWVWNAFTYYTERFESEGLENRLFTFIAILAVAGLAVWGEDGLGDNYGGFAASYLLARSLNIALWLRAGHHEPSFRPVARRFAVGFGCAVALLALSFFVEGNARLVLWALAVVVEIATPALTTRLQRELPVISRDKFPERFGLLTIIVLGEAVTGVIRGLSTANEAHALGARTIGQAVVGMGIGFGLWWLYFDFIARRPTRPLFTAALGWVYLHLLVLTGIVTVGVAVAESLAEEPGTPLPDAIRTLLLLGVGLTLVVLGALEVTLDRDEFEPTHPVLSPALKAALGALVCLLAVLGPSVGTGGAFTVCLIALAIPAAYGATVWFRMPSAASVGDGERSRSD